MGRTGRFLLVACAAAALTPAAIATAGPRAATPAPLDRPWFTAAPAELLAEAKRAPAHPDHDAIVLRDDVIVTFDERGRAEERYRVVFTIVGAAGVDDWGTLTLDWQPFYQQKPTVRARVIGPGGDVAELDPSLIHDAPSVNESPTVFSDRRVMTAPLPRLAVGSVVEEEFVLADREPLLGAGVSYFYGLRRGVPIVHKVLSISTPAALKAKVLARGPAPPARPRTTTAGGRTTITYDLVDLPVAEYRDVGAPGDQLANPHVAVATGASWAAIADGYRALVDERLARTVPLPAGVRGPTPRATVERLVAWLHQRVRYTGIELSDSAIIPFAPADTLARGFGDCKDKATLLVALLRAAGVTADLVLLSTGPGADVDPELPGMGPFDHAIVRAVVDGKDLWIDATEDLLPAGQLPSRDQGRRALVIAAGTRALVTTPIALPADNLLREVRTFRLAENGPATVVEVNEPGGVWTDGFRSAARTTSRADLDRQYRRYVERVYLGELASFTAGDPGDLAKPFSLTIEARKVGRTGAERDSLYAYLFPSDVLAELPEVLTATDAETERDAKERTSDFEWFTPHAYEIVNRLELPPGYTAPDLPAKETRALGTMTLTTTRARTTDALTVTYRLDTGKRRITAGELRAIRAAVAKLRDEEAQQVIINLDAATLKQQGKMREAIAEYRRLIALHPKEALHHGQLAQAYLHAGLGEAARREAKLGTTIEPGNADAWMVLGFMLARDLVGRQWHAGLDRAAAEAAFRKALALDPTHLGARDDLVGLLTTDDDGKPATDPARIREAIALLRAPEAEELASRDASLIAGLARVGDTAGLAELASTLPDGPLRRRATVTVTALRDGGAAALRQAENLARGDERSQLVDEVAGLLMAGRHHRQLAEIRKQTMTSASSGMVAVLDRLRAVDLARLPAADPTTPALLAMASTFGPVKAAPWGSEVEADLAELREAVAASTRGQPSIPRAALVDFALAALEPRVAGDARKGWLVEIHAPQGRMAFYVVERKGKAWLQATNFTAAAVGRTVLDAVKRGDLSAARTLLARFTDDAGGGMAPPGHELLARHRAELDAAPAPLLELAGAVLLAGRAPAEAAPILRRCAGLTAEDDRATCRRLAAGALVETGALADAAAEQTAYLATHRDDVDGAVRAASLLDALGKGAEAVRVLEAATTTDPPDRDRLALTRAQLAQREGWPAARARFEALVAPTGASMLVLNNVAWTYLYFEPSPATARALIDRATLGVGSPPSFVLNTFAAVLAESDEPYAAWKRLEASLGDREVKPADWYVLGRIAEGYGLRDDARALYARVKPWKKPAFVPTEWDLTKRRLDRLGAP